MRIRRTYLTLLLLPLLMVSSIGVAAAPGSTQDPVPVPAISASAYSPDSEECAFLGLINTYRASIGQAALTLSRTLAAAADHHALDMAATDRTGSRTFSHTMSNGTDVPTNIKNHEYPLVSSGAVAGQTTVWWGENIYAGNQSAQRAFDAWYNSSGHRANMGRAEFRAIGIGRAYDADSHLGWYWATTFGGMNHQTVNCDGTSPPPPTATPTNTPTPTAKTRITYTIVTGGRTSNANSSLLAFDNNTSTAWRTTTGNKPSYAYVWFDLGASKNVGQILWKFSNRCCADSYSVQVSTDRANWTTIATYATPSATNSWITKTWSGKIRYVRIYFKNPSGDANLGYVSEVKILSTLQ